MKRFVFIIGAVIVICTAFLIFRSIIGSLPGWSEFEGHIKNEYTFVRKVDYFAYRSGYLHIYIYLKRETTLKEVEKAFQSARSYLTSEQGLENINNYYKEKWGYKFNQLSIEYKYLGQEVYRFESSPNDYNEWTIWHDGDIKPYIPKSY